ncbi:MAG TPA: 3-isopropylmalate dehydratase small subunit [Thermoanaerobaculia bacterium]|nr:3-isopropylmalate dehydratase small subunit [Thermoanaerobaculia bacterium]
MTLPAIRRVSGTALPLRGDDIDTDRIIPARFLVSITFEGLGAHAFEDDRRSLKAKGRTHPFDDARFRGANILLVNRNFGCGSSREHAPQALARGGIKAVVGESFSEIFFGNSVAIGLPCVTAPHEAVAELQALVEGTVDAALSLDLEARTLTAEGKTLAVSIPENAREAFLSGNWDATSMLLERWEDVEAVAGRLPYVAGF